MYEFNLCRAEIIPRLSITTIIRKSLQFFVEFSHNSITPRFRLDINYVSESTLTR